MGLFSDLFGGRRKREIDALLNPVSAMTLREFAVADDDPRHIKHYIRYTNRDGKDEEFIAVYQRHGGETVYARTHRRVGGTSAEFHTLSERGPWSMAISHLIREGERLGPRTPPARGHLASRIPANLAASPPPASPGAPRRAGEAAGHSVQPGSWQARRVTEAGAKIQRFEISRSYQFSGLHGEQAQATLRVLLTMEGEMVPQGLSLSRKLRFYLWPFRLPHEAEFTMRLMTRDGASGGVFTVGAAPVEGDQDTAVIARYGGPGDVGSCVTAFMTGQTLRFNLSDEKESLVNFELPNEPSFKELYDKTCQSLAEPAGGDQQSPPPDMDTVRNNPKDYAIWLIEPEPGEYRVLLVKLKSSGDNMEDGWYLGGTFGSREEQGSFGLSAARDFRIALCDVVPGD